MLTIAIPVEQGHLNAHYGHSKSFEIVQVDPEARKIVSRQTVAAQKHEQCAALAIWLKGYQVQCVLCGGLGQGAKSSLQQQGIEVISGAPSLEISQLLESYLSGTLIAGNGLCDHDHGPHQHDHGQCGQKAEPRSLVKEA